MATLNPYRNFNGNKEDAFNFYKRVFGGEFAMLQRFRDTIESSKIPAKGLIDELNLFVNPTAIGQGLKIFIDRTNLMLIRSQAYECGVMVNKYSLGNNG